VGYSGQFSPIFITTWWDSLKDIVKKSILSSWFMLIANVPSPTTCFDIVWYRYCTIGNPRTSGHPKVACPLSASSEKGQ
jgi:hypothetical protein